MVLNDREKIKAYALAIAWWYSSDSSAVKSSGSGVCDGCNVRIPIGGGYLCNPGIIDSATPGVSDTADLICERCFDRGGREPFALGKHMYFDTRSRRSMCPLCNRPLVFDYSAGDFSVQFCERCDDVHCFACGVSRLSLWSFFRRNRPVPCATCGGDALVFGSDNRPTWWDNIEMSFKRPPGLEEVWLNRIEHNSGETLVLANLTKFERTILNSVDKSCGIKQDSGPVFFLDIYIPKGTGPGKPKPARNKQFKIKMDWKIFLSSNDPANTIGIFLFEEITKNFKLYPEVKFQLNLKKFIDLLVENPSS